MECLSLASRNILFQIICFSDNDAVRIIIDKNGVYFRFVLFHAIEYDKARK